MRISEALKQVGCIRSCWRHAARLEGTPPPDVPDGLVLETPGGQGDTPLCHEDFVVAQKWLVCAETLTQTVGGTELGGAVWRLMTDTESHLAASGPDNGERDEQ
ncbi:TPA: cytoplasmic protein [Salmonella enterica]